MGTTLVGVLVDGPQLAIGSVGDSRIYLLSRGALEQLTVDDSWAATILAQDPSLKPEEIAQHPMRNVLTNVLGARDTVNVHVTERTLDSGDTLLLCSDGLHGVLSPATLQEILGRTNDFDNIPQALVDLALDARHARQRDRARRPLRGRSMTAASLMPGGAQPESIGRYRIVERIGRGAMGVVYAAIDEQLDRKVAVKLMLSDFDEEPDLRERFYREARITGQLAHRNIVTVFDLGEHEGRPYIVMELLNGLSLAEYLQQPEAQDVDAKIDLMMQVCDGLQNAHRSGVIHRDLKPSNMFVQRDGALKILDFGVARLTASNLTASGFLVGTPEYMAPEQPQGRPVDARSDVYSAASVFYFMLTGRSPFGSRDLMRMLDAILNETPPPLTEEEAPEALRRVLTKALSKAPERSAATLW